MDHHRLSIGIDVSARWLDLATWPRSTSARFANTASGHRDLLAWLAGLGEVAGIACEASGCYERGLAETLAAAGHGVRVLPAGRVRQFARAGGHLAKTDRIDAAVIAHCAATFDGPALVLDPARRDLAERVDAGSQLLDALTTARNQSAAARLPRLRAMAEARIAQLRAWIAELDTAIAEHIAALVTSRHNPVFSTAYKRLIAAGKPPKVALGALMRKFLVTLNAIFKTQQPWSPTPTPAQT